jgi:hypothetical protein
MVRILNFILVPPWDLHLQVEEHWTKHWSHLTPAHQRDVKRRSGYVKAELGRSTRADGARGLEMVENKEY